MILRDVEGHWVHSPDILQNRTALRLIQNMKSFRERGNKMRGSILTEERRTEQIEREY